MNGAFGRCLVALAASVLPIAWPQAVPAQAPSASASAPVLSLAELRARYGDRNSRYTTIAGLDVHYKDEGRGPVLLLVHGSSSTMRTWDGVVARLKGRYRLIRYDVPGQGLSGNVSDAAAAAVQPAEIAEGLLAKLGVGHATVVGVSSGGTLAIYLAAKRPDLVERVVVSNAPSDPVDTSGLVPTPAWAKAQANARAQGYQDNRFWNEFLTYFAGDGRRIDATTRASFGDFNRRTPDRNTIALTAKVADHARATAAMAAVRAPTLLIWGGSDKLLPPSAGRNLLRYLKNTDVSIVYLPDVGHFPPIETPDRFSRVLATWIEAAAPALTTDGK